MLKELKRQILLILHRGERYICPFCNYRSKDLKAIGLDLKILKDKQVVGAGRRLGGCFKCDSIDRERMVYVYLKEKTNFLDPERNLSILHIAPERNLSKKIGESGIGNYVCGALSPEAYSPPENVKDIDILDIPYRDGEFDLIICNHVLEHIPTDLVAMKELARVLKSGGKAILQVPISKNSELTYEDFSVTDQVQREEVFGQFDHVRIYGKDYTKRLESAGFKVSRVNVSFEFKRFGLNEEEDIFVCEKGD